MSRRVVLKGQSGAAGRLIGAGSKFGCQGILSRKGGSPHGSLRYPGTADRRHHRQANPTPQRRHGSELLKTMGEPEEED